MLLPEWQDFPSGNYEPRSARQSWGGATPSAQDRGHIACGRLPPQTLNQKRSVAKASPEVKTPLQRIWGTYFTDHGCQRSAKEDIGGVMSKTEQLARRVR